MADLLDDDWWQQEKKNSGAVLKTGKRKNPQMSDEATKPKRNKKTKTEELQKKPSNPATDKDLFALIRSTTESTMSVIEKEQLNFENVRVVSSEDTKSPTSEVLLKMLPDVYGVLVKKKLNATGAPRMIILTGGALRVISLRKLMIDLGGPDCKVAKLFAKHMKVKEQCSFLSKSVVHVAVGTPKRISELIDLDALKLNRLRYLAIDWNFRDKKLQRMVDLTQVKNDLVDALIKHFIPTILENNAKIMLL